MVFILARVCAAKLFISMKYHSALNVTLLTYLNSVNMCIFDNDPTYLNMKITVVTFNFKCDGCAWFCIRLFMIPVIGWNEAIGDRKIFNLLYKNPGLHAYIVKKAYFLYFIIRDIFTMIRYTFV